MARISKKTAVSESIIGKCLSREVYAKHTTYVFIRKDVIITNIIYWRLVEEDIKEVFVYEDLKEIQPLTDDTAQKIEAARHGHIMRTDKLTHLFDDVISAGKLDMAETSKICAEIIHSNNDKYDIFLLLNSLRSVDDYLYSHSINVAMLAGLLGKWLDFSEPEIECLTMCGLLHDIGKTLVDMDILQKKGKLSENEFAEIKTHTVKGYQLLERQDVPRQVKETAYMHHEKIDGTGYPRGLTDARIPAYAKIISIVDIFDAMSNARVYREKIHSPFCILKEFKDGVYGKLDLKYLSVFLHNVAYMYIEAKCVLSDGRQGRIVFINPLNLYAPIVEVNGEMIDLKFETNLTIDSVIMS